MHIAIVLRVCRSWFHRCVIAAPSNALMWVLTRTCKFEFVGGIRVGESSGKPSRGFVDLVSDALALVQHHDAVRWRRIVREVRFIVSGPCVREVTYGEALRCCLVDLSFMSHCSRQTMTALTAALLIEAATAGHLRRRGVLRTRKYKGRFDDFCAREAWDFLYRHLGVASHPWEPS